MEQDDDQDGGGLPRRHAERLAAFGQAPGRGNGVEVRTLTPGPLDTAGGRILTISVEVTNRTANTEELVEALDLPAGWQPIMPSGSFTLRAGEATTRIKAFQVPRGAAAGRYDVTTACRGSATRGSPIGRACRWLC